MQHTNFSTIKTLIALLVVLTLSACSNRGSTAATPPATSTASQDAPAASQPGLPASTPAVASTVQGATGSTGGDQAIAAPAPPTATIPIPHIDPIKSTPALAAEGKKLFFTAGCNACHGGTGGGGMCPPLTNSIWVYGSDDSTLDTLIKEGSQSMQTTHGLKRVGHENVVGIMPAFGSVLKDEDIHKLLAFIHSINPTAGKGQTPSAGASR